MVLSKKRANLSRYTISGTAVNQEHGGPMPVVCIYMFIEVYIICDCKAVFVMREQRESRSTRRGDLHSPQPFFLFTLSPFIERYITLHPCDVKDSMLNCIRWCFCFVFLIMWFVCDLRKLSFFLAAYFLTNIVCCNHQYIEWKWSIIEDQELNLLKECVVK